MASGGGAHRDGGGDGTFSTHTHNLFTRRTLPCGNGPTTGRLQGWRAAEDQEITDNGACRIPPWRNRFGKCVWGMPTRLVRSRFATRPDPNAYNAPRLAPPGQGGRGPSPLPPSSGRQAGDAMRPTTARRGRGRAPRNTGGDSACHAEKPATRRVLEPSVSAHHTPPRARSRWLLAMSTFTKVPGAPLPAIPEVEGAAPVNGAHVGQVLPARSVLRCSALCACHRRSAQASPLVVCPQTFRCAKRASPKASESSDAPRSTLTATRPESRVRVPRRSNMRGC